MLCVSLSRIFTGHTNQELPKIQHLFLYYSSKSSPQTKLSFGLCHVKDHIFIPILRSFFFFLNPKPQWNT